MVRGQSPQHPRWRWGAGGLESGTEILSVSLTVEVTAVSRGWKRTLQGFITLSLGRCAQTECSWPHRTDASGGLSVSDVAAVVLLAHLERSWLYKKVVRKWGMCTVF